MSRIVIVCPDTNIKLWVGRSDHAPIGGGKSAILHLAGAWARLGHDVTVAGAFVEESRAAGLQVIEMAGAGGPYDVGIYVTGSLGHFRVPGVEGIRARRSIFWLNGPGRVEAPECAIDYYVVPSRFMARRAIEDWGLPVERVVVIRGEAVRARREITAPHNPSAFVYASHPSKGLDLAVAVLSEFRNVSLDVYSGPVLWGDAQPERPQERYPPWVNLHGPIPQLEVERNMARYGAMIYTMRWVESFSPVTAEAMNSGVIVIGAAHGAMAEIITHGWNGFLVSVKDGEPSREEAVAIVREYLKDPASFSGMRRHAMASVQTWDEQAARWQEVWEQ